MITEAQQTQLVQLDQLQTWLRGGWAIEEPVLCRSVVYDRRGRVCAYEVVVRQQYARRVIALPDVPDVHEFLRQQQIGVLHLD